MAVASNPTAPAEPTPSDLVGSAPPSPAGPAEPGDLARLPGPPLVPVPRALQVLRFNQRQIEFVFHARRKLGEVFRMSGIVAGSPWSPAIPTTCARCSRPRPSWCPR